MGLPTTTATGRGGHDAARWPPKGTDAVAATGAGLVQRPRCSSTGQHALAEPVGALEVRVGREHELVDAERGVLLDPVGDLLVAADERGAGAAADQADAGPEVGVDLEVVLGCRR